MASLLAATGICFALPSIQLRWVLVAGIPAYTWISLKTYLKDVRHKKMLDILLSPTIMIWVIILSWILMAYVEPNLRIGFSLLLIVNVFGLYHIFKKKWQPTT